MEDWYERVGNAIGALHMRREADKREFEDIWKILNHGRSRQEGERLERQGGAGVLFFKEAHVFTFFVEDGVIAIRGNGERNFGSSGEALAHMAALVALADERHEQSGKKAA